MPIDKAAPVTIRLPGLHLKNLIMNIHQISPISDCIHFPKACRIDRRASPVLVEICIFAIYGNRDGCQRNTARTLHKRFSYCCMIVVLLCTVNTFLYLCNRNLNYLLSWCKLNQFIYRYFMLFLCLYIYAVSSWDEAAFLILPVFLSGVAILGPSLCWW